MQPTVLCPFSLLGFVLPIFICFGSVWLVYQLMYMVAAFSIIVCKRSRSPFFLTSGPLKVYSALTVNLRIALPTSKSYLVKNSLSICWTGYFTAHIIIFFHTHASCMSDILEDFRPETGTVLNTICSVP